MPSRRSLLAGTASLLAAGAGCTGVLDESSPGAALRDITLRNIDDEAHALAVQLSREDEVILDETYDLGRWPYGDDGGTESGEKGTTTDETETTTDETATTTAEDTATTARHSAPADDCSDHLAAITDAWDSPRGEFTARVRVDDREPVEFRLDDGVSPGATYRYEIHVEDDGGVSTWSAVLDSAPTTAA